MNAVGPQPHECVIALDLGGTSIKGALVDRHAGIVRELRAPTARHDEHEAVLDQLVEMIAELSRLAGESGWTPRAVGVVVIGIVDEHAGVAVTASNHGWVNLPVRSHLQQRTSLPVAFGHDVRAGGLAESVLGAGRGVDDLLFLAIGTGISAAMVLGGRPYAGGGYAGEIGHIVVEPDGRPCGCGNRGCLEAVASAAAIAARYAEWRGGTEHNGEESGEHSDRIDTAEVVARASGGERIAAQVWDQAIDALATVLASYVCLLAPDRIVIGGGLASAGETLLHPLRERLAARLTFQPLPALVAAELGELAGSLGAALSAWEYVDRWVLP